jgi:predicted DNA-binding transcriptional regulator YafY
MSLSDTYFRHLCILRKLQKAPASQQEIKDYYETECETHGYNFIFSSRTFLRDKEDILSLYKKDIQYNISTRKYFLEEDIIPDDFGNRITDAYNTYLALNMADDVAEYIHLEKRRPQGMEQFSDLLNALRDKLVIRFGYEKYYGQHFSERKVEPLALKEFESRWYLLAKDLKDNAIKTFALDRISSLELTRQKYKLEKGFDVNDYFRNCFGIIRPSERGIAPADIHLSFKGDRGKYIKSLPLHESQQIIKDEETELQVSLKLYITHDLIMELLSHGDEVEVLQPESLRDKLKQILDSTGKFYK